MKEKAKFTQKKENISPLISKYKHFFRYHYRDHLSLLEDVYMGSEVNSNRFEVSNRFEKSFRLHGNFNVSNLGSSNRFQKLSCLHGDFTAATFQTIARLYCTCENDVF